MVGREGQLDALREVAARTRTGRPGTILVLGEAGVGKTRLATELVAELETDGFLCPASHGVELADVRRLLGSNANSLGALVPALGQPQPAAPVDRAVELGRIAPLTMTFVWCA